MRLTSSRVRSFNAVMLARLSVGTISTTWLAAKSTREAGLTAFSSTALSMAFWSAEANTSAGAPDDLLQQHVGGAEVQDHLGAGMLFS